MKNLIYTLTLIAFVSAFISCGKQDKKEDSQADVASEEVTPSVTALTAQAVLAAKSNSALTGTASFEAQDSSVSFKVEISGLEAGSYAVHIHENGDCSADDASSAGGHWNPSDSEHGAWGGEAFHSGDIGNIQVDSTGMGVATLTTNLWCVDCDDSTRNVVGKAVVVHAKKDDLTSQPSGAAGPRIGCGVIEMATASSEAEAMPSEEK